METFDSVKIALALRVFTYVFEEGEWGMSLFLGIFFLMRSHFSGETDPYSS